MPENRTILNKNSIEIKNSNIKFEKDKIWSLIQQKPNKNFFGIIPFKIWVYNIGSKGKETKFKKWLKNKIGEEPIYLDNVLTISSVKQIKQYLNNIGYFNSEVNENITLNKKKANVNYSIFLAKPYKIRNIKYSISDKKVKFFTLSDNANTLLHKNDIYSAYTLEKEREQIATFLKNQGYYYFNSEYIYYEIDSAFNNNELDITIAIKNCKTPTPDKDDKYTEQDHKQYHINNIFINPNYNPLSNNKFPFDTLVKTIPSLSKSNPDVNYYFLYHDKLNIKPQTIIQSIYIHPDQLYIFNKEQQTYKRLAALRMFKYANIQFNTIHNNSGNENLLNCYIKLSRSKVQSYSIEAEGTNSGGDLGVGGNLVYQNKNIFRGAEIFRLKLKGAMEVQKTSDLEEDNNSSGFLFFNTIETGVEASLYFPKFLIPISQTQFPKFYKPKTTINTGINYQKRPKYTRYITNFTFSYDWSKSEYETHIFTPFDMNSVKVSLSKEFDSIIQNSSDLRLKDQYTNHLIAALKYSYIFNNQDINKQKNFFYFRGNFETSGNLFNAINSFIKAPTNADNKYTVLNIKYAQYVKVDFDFRYYNIIDKDNTLVFHALFGIGIPYGNSDVLPFEKGFYAGGANDMRGWKIRSLGPGAFQGTYLDFDKMGDLKMEANLEYRFLMYKFLKGAFFVDAGNVWLLNENISYPNGSFKINTFLNQFAIDAGIGFRFDFGFFLFRIDGAIPLRNPALAVDHRWVINTIKFNDIVWNFGIGYPF
ncbi:MAG: BamA/TamA family outer membrane protein [Bacteroidales bacterium]|nr:BamA/TamA family outer membrane protein [Bacteroidales bacterium]